MAGYDFFIEAYKIFDAYMDRNGINFDFALQTNGTLLDDKFIDFFEAKKTHVSVSYDGPFNSFLRQNTEKTETAIDRLKAKGVVFSCLSTISSASVGRLSEIYDYFKQIAVPVKFSPVLADGAAEKNRDVLISKEEWTDSFINLFDYWFFDLSCNVEFYSFHQILRKYLSLSCHPCKTSSDSNNHDCLNTKCLFGTIAINSEGNLYPCGRLVEERYKLANVFSLDDLREAFLTSSFLDVLDKNKQRAIGCSQCKWFGICNSGCYASALLGGDMAKPFDFDCYFNHRVFSHIEALLKDYESSRINKYAKRIINLFAN